MPGLDSCARRLFPSSFLSSFLSGTLAQQILADILFLSARALKEKEKRRSLPARKIIIKKRRTPAMGYDLWIPNPPELYSFFKSCIS